MRIKKSRASSIKKLAVAVREEKNRIVEGSNSHNAALLRKKFREILAENEAGPSRGLFAKQSAYGGMFVEDASGEPVSMGEMLLHLVNAGDTAFFDTPDGTDSENLEKILSRHNDGVQGGVERWDADVFNSYYGVNLVKLINRYAYNKEMRPVNWLGEDDELPSDKAWREQNTPLSPTDDIDDGEYEFESEYS